MHHAGIAIAGPPSVSVRSLLETSDLTAMRRFDYRDGGLGRLWLEKHRADANRQPSVRKGTLPETGREKLDMEEPLNFQPPPRLTSDGTRIKLWKLNSSEDVRLSQGGVQLNPPFS